MKKRSPIKIDLDFRKYVYGTLIKEIPDENAAVIRSHNYYWPDGNKSSSQLTIIDHRGIFLFACENYEGLIKGFNTSSWKQSFPDNDQELQWHRIPNPLRLIHMHIRCMKANIDLGDIPIYTVVIVSDRCDVSRLETEEKTVVINFRYLGDTIMQLGSSSGSILSNDQIRNLRDKIREIGGLSKKKIATRETPDQTTVVECEPKYVIFNEKNSRKGLKQNKRYKVIREDGEYYWLEGIDGKSMKSRFRTE